MEKNKILKVLVPVVAVVIILESVLLVEGVVSKKKNTMVIDTKQEEIKNPAFDIGMKLDKSALTVGGLGKVEVTAKTKTARQLDNVNLYVQYDPSMVTVTNLVFPNKLPKPTYQKISDKRGMVVVNYYVTDKPEGYGMKAGESVVLATFEIQPKKTGVVDLEISTGNEMKESVTMIVENATGEALPFSSNKLSINVVK